MERVFLGIVQGLTEFLPVSSSAHLAIFGKILKDVDLSFFTLLHLGTLLAVVWFLRKDLGELIVLFFKFDKRALKILLYIVISTIPAAFSGLIFSDKIESTFTQDKTIALFLLITGIVLLISDFKKDGNLDVQKLGILNALIIGMFQSFALFPGISRSGMTLVAGLLIGLKRKETVRYSFLISIPAILGAFVLESGGLEVDVWNILGFFASMGVGVGSLYFLKLLTIKRKLKYFAYYCWIVAGLIFVGLI